MDQILFGCWKLVAMHFSNLDRVRESEGITGGTLILTGSGHVTAFLKANRQVLGVCGKFTVWNHQRITLTPDTYSGKEIHELVWEISKLTPSELTLRMNDPTLGPCIADFRLLSDAFLY